MKEAKNLLKGSVFTQVGVRKLVSDVRMDYTRDFTLGRTVGCIVRSILEMVVFTISHLFWVHIMTSQIQAARPDEKRREYIFLKNIIILRWTLHLRCGNYVNSSHISCKNIDLKKITNFYRFCADGSLILGLSITETRRSRSPIYQWSD